MNIPKIFKNSAIYSLVTILQKGVSFFLLPLYTAFLTPDDYGTINVVLSLSSFIAVLIMMALNGAGTRFHYKNTDNQYRQYLWGTITTIVIISSIAWGTIFLIFHKYLIDPFIGDISFFPYVLLGIANTVITPLYILFQSYLQASQKALNYSLNAFSNFLVQITLAIVFIAVFKMGALGMLLANVVTALIFFIYVLFVFVPRIKIGINKGIASDSFKYSLPLLPHQISIWSAGSIDKLILNDIKGSSSTGLLSVGHQFGTVVGTIAYSVNQAFVPWFFEQIKTGKEGIQKIQTMGNCAILLYSFIALVISLFAPEILKVMVSDSFQSAWKVIPFICFAFVFHGVYFFFINVLFIKDTGLVFVVTMLSMLIDIIANIIFVPKWGLIGCGLACLLTYLTRSIMAMVLSIIKNKEIRYNYYTIYFVVTLLFAISNVNWFLSSESMFLSITIKLGLCTITGAFFYLKYFSFLKQFLLNNSRNKQ